MLISPDNPATKYLAARAVVVDENNEQVKTIYSFDTVTKEAEVFMLNPKGEVRVYEGKPVTEKKIQAKWRVLDKYTKKEII